MLGVKPPDVSVCATCPFRGSNHGKRHPAKWYTKANLTRIWNGIRLNKAPGMVCHSSDPNSKNYGSIKDVPETAVKHECGGLLQLIYREFTLLNTVKTYKEYQALSTKPFIRGAIAFWANRQMSNNLPNVISCDDVRLPWDKP